MHKRGSAIYLMITGVLLYILSLLMPWITVGFGELPGYAFHFYVQLIFFIYPVYTVIRNVSMSRRYGLLCGIVPIAALVMFYFSVTGKNDALELTVVKASFGYYTALFGSVLVLIGIFMKLRTQNKTRERESE